MAEFEIVSDTCQNQQNEKLVTILRRGNSIDTAIAIIARSAVLRIRPA
jgi:hypothetical protein